MLFFGEGHGVNIPNYRLVPGQNIYKKSTEFNKRLKLICKNYLSNVLIYLLIKIYLL